MTAPNCMEKEQLEHASNDLFFVFYRRKGSSEKKCQKLTTEFAFGLTIHLIPNVTEDKPMRNEF